MGICKDASPSRLDPCSEIEPVHTDSIQMYESKPFTFVCASVSSIKEARADAILGSTALNLTGSFQGEALE